MICGPCKRGAHYDCPEQVRLARVRQTWTAVVQGAVVRSCALTTGQLCDCAHQPGPSLGLAQPK